MPDMKIIDIYRSALPIQEMRHGLDEYLNHVCLSMNWSYCNYMYLCLGLIKGSIGFSQHDLSNGLN